LFSPFDLRQTARVTLEGTLDGHPFILSRTKTASKGELLFQFDGEDFTTLSVKETQALVEETLGVDAHLLSRTMFHGQHGMNDLLEATDAKLKDELSLVVPLGLWQVASTMARSKTRQARKKGDEVSGMIELRKEDVQQFAARLSPAKGLKVEKEHSFDEFKNRIAEELEELESNLNVTRNQDTSKVQAELKVIMESIEDLTGRYKSLVGEQEAALLPLETEQQRAKEALAVAKLNLSAAEQALVSSEVQLDTARSALGLVEQKWSVDLSNGVPEMLAPPETCPTCRQVILEGNDEDSHLAIENTMCTEIENTISALEKAEQTHKKASEVVLEARQSLRLGESAEIEAKKAFQKVSLEWATKLDELEEKINCEKKQQNELTSEISNVLERSHLLARRDAIVSELNMKRTSRDYARETYIRLEEEVTEAKQLLQSLEDRKADCAATERAMSDLGERFGQRGVQTYVLQNAINSLESLTQTYLDQMSDGGIRLELSLDAGDKITRRAFVLGSDGKFRERPLSTLSGGQWRRCSLALTFGFAELVARRGRLRSSICVLDEPLTHLDRLGRDKFSAVVRGMIRRNQAATIEDPVSDSPSIDQNRVSGFGMSTIILILQDLAAEELEEAFDCIDTVVKENGVSSVLVDSE
jgi:DNA repair exonuclease SbcCD ATPase subunit